MERHAHAAKLVRLSVLLGWLLIVGVGMTVASGCTRRFFRNRADEEVAEVLADKDRYPEWRIEQMHVYPDTRARFADDSDPDHPLMPPDDPASWALSPHPQKPGKRGTKQVEGTGYLDLMTVWDRENRAERAGKSPSPAGGAEEAEAGAGELLPVPREEGQAGTTDKPPATTGQLAAGQGYTGGSIATAATSLSSPPGTPLPYLLKLEQAVELAGINSREFQDARENLYLSALPVTLERFAFAAQFFAVDQAVRQWAGTEPPTTNQWSINSNTGVAKLFPTGALLLFNVANQMVFNLGPGRDFTTQSTLNFDFVQPLLRGGGLAANMEPLTSAERNLLYAIRNYDRFRKTLFVAIAGGGGGSITGSTFQPQGVIAANTGGTGGGVSTTSGINPGVLVPIVANGNAGLRVTPGPSGQITLQTALAAPVSGYLSTLLQAAQMRVDQYNLDKLLGFLQLARAMEEGGDISNLQTAQFEQQVLIRRSTLLTDQLQYLQSLDQFKLQLGLPTALPIELDDGPFRALNQQFERYENLFKQFEATSDEPTVRFNAPEFVPTVRKELLRLFTTSAIVQGTRFKTHIEGSWGAWAKLTGVEVQKRLAGYREERRRLLDKKTELENKNQTLSEADQQQLNRLSFEIDLADFEMVLRDYESQPWKKAATPELQHKQQQAQFHYVVNAFIVVLAEARGERVIQLRNLWPEPAKLCVNGVDLLKADIDEAQAVVAQTALIQRLDLMNVRGETVDAWRQLAVFANALLSPLDIRYSMSTSTPPGLAQPLNFGRPTHQLILDTELPLVRKQERNNYRGCLINYQRARRILQRAEDQVQFDVRGELRQLRQQEESYRIQQRQIELSYMTVENSLDTFRAPPAPGLQVDPATRAASLTNQLIQAQSSLYQAQFLMTTIWITYLNTRLQLYRDMELMPLDTRGVWIDDTSSQCNGGSPTGPDGADCNRPADQRPVP
jgi:hypothetical protein